MMKRNPVAFSILAVLLMAAVGIALRPLTPIDETRYLSVAWEMHQTGNWLVPSKNFMPYSDKPPLLFWAINLVWLVTGVSEFAARLVVPFFAGLAVWLCALLARKLWPEDQGVAGRAALALASLTLFSLSAGLTMFDVPLSVAVLIGLICLLNAGSQVGTETAVRHRALLPWAGYGAAVALGVLTKGPVVLFHLLPAAILLPLWAPERLRWRQTLFRTGFGLMVGVALVALWLIPAALAGGQEYRDAILWHQSAGRLSQSFAHARPWWTYLVLMPVLAFPLFWSPALWRAAHAARWRADPGMRLCIVWGLAALVLFSLTSGKQMHYLLPEMGAVALIAARLSGGVQKFGIVPAAIVLILVACAAILAGLGLIPLGQAAELLQPRTALIAWALLMLAICWIAIRQGGFAGMLLLSMGGLTATNLLIGLTEVGANYSTHEIAAALAPYDDKGIAWPGVRYHAEFNFPARLTHAVATPSGEAELQEWGASHPGGVILARWDAAHPRWPPFAAFRFRSQDYGLWSATSPE